VLLTSPDAENAEAIAERIEAMGRALSGEHAESGLQLEIVIEPLESGGGERGPCDPCDDSVFGG